MIAMEDNYREKKKLLKLKNSFSRRINVYIVLTNTLRSKVRRIFC